MKVKKYIYNITIIILSFLLISIICSFNISKMVLLSLPMILIDSLILAGHKKTFHFLYQYRFLVVGIVFLILVLGKYHGSSISKWNEEIQPNYNIESAEPLFFHYQEIRSDEWGTSTPITISQLQTDPKFQYFSPLIRGGNTDMFISYGGPVKDIVNIAWPFKLGYLLFGEEYGLSCFWWGRIISLFIISFEFMIMMSKKKKRLSLAYAIMISCSPAIHWWYSVGLIDTLLFGQLILLLLYKFLKAEKSCFKFMIAITMAISLLSYFMILYPSWQIGFGFIYIIIGIYIIYHNRRALNLIDWASISLCIIITLIILLRIISLGNNVFSAMTNTSYPWNMEKEYAIVADFFNYPLSIILPYLNASDITFGKYTNACEIANFISLFPLPLILSLYYLFKSKEKNTLVFALSILMMILIVFCLVPLPNIVYKITLFSLFNILRIKLVVGFLSILLFFLILNDNSFWKKLNKKEIALFILISITCIALFSDMESLISSNLYYLLIIISALLLIAMCLAFIKRFRYIGFSILTMTAFISVLSINPIQQGTTVLHEKPVAKEIKKLVKDSSKKWVALNHAFLPNYLVANGASTINTVHYYPNLEMWHKIDPNRIYEDIYNQYAHINVTIGNITSFRRVSFDLIEATLTYEALKNLEVDYIVTTTILPYSSDISLLYYEDNIAIYKII